MLWKIPKEVKKEAKVTKGGRDVDVKPKTKQK